MGVIAHVFGYLSLWLAATERVSFQYWQLVAICLLASNSIVWLDTCLLATNIRNFPFEKGTIAGAEHSLSRELQCLLSILVAMSQQINKWAAWSASSIWRLQCCAHVATHAVGFKKFRHLQAQKPGMLDR